MLMAAWMSVPALALERGSKALYFRLNDMALGQVEQADVLPLRNAPWVQEFYVQFQYRSQWLTPEGALNAAAEALVLKINQATLLALRPDDYHLEVITTLLARHPESDESVQVSLELLLTDAFYLLAYHSGFGKLDSESLAVKWQLDDAWARKFLAELVDLSPEEVIDVLQQSEPPHAGYLALKQAFEKRLGLESSGPQEAFVQPIIKLGNDHADVILLRKMLAALNYDVGEATTSVFDDSLKAAVMLFQEQHGLERDGSAGLFTQQALIENYYGDSQKMAVNLERWRWLPKDLGRDHIVVNVASFELQYIRDDKVFLSMKTVVGKNYRKTPLFSDVMQYMVLNPSWSVPHKIASEDLLRKQQNDPTYLQTHKIDVYRGWGPQQEKVDTDEVMWSTITTKKFPFNLRQRPGPLNALGKVKFIFPNEHDVYLHDTNDKSLFSRSYRAYSSGCIRVSQPLELLYAIAEHNTQYSKEKIASLLSAGNEATVMLSTPLPVHLQYWTAWVDAAENLHYRSDIYDRDKPMLEALQSAFEVNN